MTISTAPAATNEGSLQKELKACRLQLQQAERRSAATIESRDGVAKKLEEATDQIAELQRRLELEAHQRDVCAREIAAKEANLSRNLKDRSELESTLNLVRMENEKLKERMAEDSTNNKALEKSSKQLESALVKEKELATKLQKTINSLVSQQSVLRNQCTGMEKTITSLKREAEVTGMQLRAGETALVETKQALQRALRDAEEAQKSKQLHKQTAKVADTLKKELRHLGIELMREQDAMAERENQWATQQLAATHRPELIAAADGNDTVASDSKVAALQRRLIEEKEAAAVLKEKLNAQEEEMTSLKKALERRMEQDEMQKGISRLTGLLNLKSKELRAAKAENAAMQAASRSMASGSLASSPSMSNLALIAEK